MLKTTSLLIIAATSLLSAQAAFASTEQVLTEKSSTGVCISTLSQGTDGADRFDVKMAKHQAKRAGSTVPACVTAKVFLNVGSNGTDGVDRFDAKLAKQQANKSIKATAAIVGLNLASNGTDGVDRFDSRMSQIATQ